MSALARRERPRWSLFIGGALLLHAALILSLRQAKTDSNSAARSVAPPQAVEVEVEVEVEPEAASLASAPARPLTPAAPAPRAPSAARAPIAPTQRAALDPSSPDDAAALGGAAQSAPEGEAVSAPRAPLSLAELGVAGENRFVTAAASGEATAPTPRKSASELGRERFQRAMATQIALADRALSLGPEGPVLSAVERATRADNPEPNSRAVFEFTTDSSGKVTGVTLLKSSSAPEPWRRVAEAARRALRGKALKLPRTGYGATLRVRVISRIELPSGADPGLDVNVLGIPLKKGAGPRSARIDILALKPELSDAEETLPSGQTLHVPRLRLGQLFSMSGDLSDIGAKPAQSVRAHLERLTLNEPPR